MVRILLSPPFYYSPYTYRPRVDTGSPDNYWMEQALAQARLAAQRGEVPVGAVVVDPHGRLLAYDHNRKEALSDPTAHAEMGALRLAARARGSSWYLDGCTLYSSLEPCAMCYGAAVQARIARIVYGAPEPKFGALGSTVDLSSIPFNHRIDVVAAVRSHEAAELMRAFFKLRRTDTALD